MSMGSGNGERIVFAYSGTGAGSACIAWLRERYGAGIVALTVDVGQAGDLDEVRARALACGALRAHVVDARDAFARDFAVPALRGGATADELDRLADVLIARSLVEIARVEAADALAHASAGTSAFHAAVGRACAAAGLSLPVRLPLDECGGAGLLACAKRHAIAGAVTRTAPHLLVRTAADPTRAPLASARLDITFADGVPASLNDVPMAPQELIESVSLIAGQYGIGHDRPRPMPGAQVLQAAYEAANGRDGVRVVLTAGSFSATPAGEAAAPLTPATAVFEL